MQIVLDADEAWSIMAVVTSYVIDNGGLSADGKARLRAWRSQRGEGTREMDDLAAEINAAWGRYIDDKTNRVVSRKGRHKRRQAK